MPRSQFLLALSLCLAAGFPPSIARGEGTAKDDAEDLAIIGHVAWSSASRGASRLARFYSQLFDLTPRLVDAAFLRSRIEAEYALLRAGEIAIDRPVGVVFIGRSVGTVERVEFGFTPKPREADSPPSGSSPSDPRAVELRLSTRDPALVDLVTPYARAFERDRDQLPFDLSLALDLAAAQRTCVPPLSAGLSMFALLLPSDDPRRAAIELGDRVVATLSREIESLRLGVRFDGEELGTTLDLRPRPNSSLERTIARAFPIESSSYPTSDPEIAALGECGVDLVALLEGLGVADLGSGREDRSGFASRVRWRVVGERRALLLTIPESGSSESSIPWASESESKLPLTAVRSAGEFGVAIGDPELARVPLVPWRITELDPFLEPPRVAEDVAIGAFDFSLPRIVGATGAAATSPRASRLIALRRPGNLRFEVRLPLDQLAAAVPRTRFRTP